MIGEASPDTSVMATLKGAELVTMDVSDKDAVAAVFDKFPDISHCIHLAYLMSAEVEANTALGAKVNVLGMVNMFDAGCVTGSIAWSSPAEIRSTAPGNRSTATDQLVREDDFGAPSDHFFTYGMMKILE